MFELNISCTKELSTLKIDFTDGTSVVEYRDKQKPKKKSAPRASKKTKTTSKDIDTSENVAQNRSTGCLDLDADYSHVSSEVVSLPDVTRTDREVKIAPELQNLDI